MDVMDGTAELKLQLAEAQNAMAEMEKSLSSLKQNADDFFLVTMAMIVYFMQAGFAFLEAGSVRHRNTTNILLQNMMVAWIGGISYWAVGFALSYGDRNPAVEMDPVGGEGFGGHKYFFSAGFHEKEFSYWFFEYASCVTACTIVTGALAERLHLNGFFAFVIVFTGLTYPIVSHWVWSPVGWLMTGSEYNITAGGINGTDIVYKAAFWDTAGSTVVHIVGGTTAFVSCFLLGPRPAALNKEGKLGEEVKGHSIPLVCLGAWILMFGFFAFNSGAQDKISREGDGEAIARSCKNTVISASFAAVVGLGLSRCPRIGTGKWSLVITINACLAGFVAICGGCNIYEPWEAAIIGALAACSYRLWATIALHVVKIDDPLEATGVHFGGGLWGTFAVPLFAPKDGLLLNWNAQSGYFLMWQAIGFLAIFVWTGLVAALLFGVLKLAKQLRESDENIENGQDIVIHGEDAYAAESWGHSWPEEPTLGHCVHRHVTRNADVDNNEITMSGEKGENVELLKQA